MSKKSKAAEFVDERYQVHVMGRNVLITDAMKNYAIEKISKLEKFSDRIIDVHVTMDIQKLEHRVDITLKVNHIQIKSHASSTYMYTSIDEAVEKIEAQLVKYKKKLQDHQAKGLTIIDMKTNLFHLASEDEILDVNIAIEDETRNRIAQRYLPGNITEQKEESMRTLSIEEAKTEMAKFTLPHLLFLCEEDKSIKLIQLQDDGNYSITNYQT